MAMVSMMACTISCCCICILGLAKLIGLVHLMKCITSQSQNSRLRSFSFPVMLACMCGIHSLFLLLVMSKSSSANGTQGSSVFVLSVSVLLSL